MSCFTEDLLAIILARLPLKSFTTCKLVCKQWKSIVESSYFRNLFLSLHQNSHTSCWSLMSWPKDGTEVIAHYERNNTWGLERSLGSYVSSFISDKFKTSRHEYEVWDYTDIGLILIREAYCLNVNPSLYVANPISKECVEIPSHAHLKQFSYPLGIATRTEDGVLLGYKVVLRAFDEYKSMKLSFLIYSSESGLWSLNTVHLSLPYHYFSNSFSLKGSIHWISCNTDNEEVFVSMDFYADGIGSVQYRVTPFPDSGKRFKFKRFCRISNGFIVYMNIVSVTKDDGTLEDMLCVWRLKSGEWQLISQVIVPAFDNPIFECFPVTINPLDAKTVYLWSKKHQSLLLINLSSGKFVIHSELERSGDGCIECTGFVDNKQVSNLHTFVLPQWLHRIPKTVRRV